MATKRLTETRLSHIYLTITVQRACLIANKPPNCVMIGADVPFLSETYVLCEEIYI